MPNYEGIAFKVIISKNFDGVVFKTVMLSGAKIMDSQINSESTWSSEHLAKLLPKGEASGSIATFDDGAGDVPLISCVADFMATQDLHGQSAPYPAGASPNKWNEEWELGTYSTVDGRASISENAIRSKNKIAVLPNTSYAFFNSTSNAQIRLYYYASDESFISYTAINAVNNVATFTTPENVAWINFAVGNSVTPVTTNNKNLSINYPSSDTSYHPYSNICPIIPIDEINITRAGKNLIAGIIENAGIGASGVISGSTTNNVVYAPVKSGQTYTLHTSSNVIVYGYYKEKPIKSSVSYNGTRTQVNSSVVTITAEIDGWVALRTPNTDTTSQIELGSTATEYAQPISTTETINLGSEYYGGSDDVGKGKIIANFAKIVFDGSQSNSEFAFYTQNDKNRIAWNPYQTLGKVGSRAFKSDKLATANGYYGMPDEWTVANSGASVARCFIGVPNTITSVADWQAYVTSNPITLVYELASPIEAQAENVASIITLDGVNHIFADSGDVDVQYFLDIKKYIDNLVNPSNTRTLSNGLNLTREAPSVPDEVEEEEEESQETNEER